MEFSWQATWIWADAQGQETSRHFYLRRTFTLGETEILSAALRVCADSRYRLYLNGQLLGHGPARSAPAQQYYDLYDVHELLRPGKNALCALVTHYGIGTCYSCLGSPGFLLQLDLEYGDGQTQTVSSDSAWRIAAAPFETGFERMSIQLAWPEVFDARCEPVNWNLTGFDDSEWTPATVLGPVGIAPWTTLIPRDIPLPTSRAIAPTAILQVNRVDRSGEAELDAARRSAGQTRLSPAAGMLRATRYQPAAENAVTYTHPALFTVAPQSGDIGVSVVIDFGREVSGFPLIIPRKGSGGRIDIGYSERIETDGTINPAHTVGSEMEYADRLWLRAGFQRYEPLDHRAFRYMRLDFYDNPEPIEILVEMTLSGYPVEKRGAFQCSDALLQRIWEVGRYTTELCMDDGFMDCPFRERGQWLGDIRVEGLVAAYAFGDTALLRKALLQFPQSQEQSGWFRGVFPSDTVFDALLPTFCFIWPVAVWDYFLLTGDRTLLEAVWPHVERLVGAMEKARDRDGLLSDLPGWVFVDWAPLNTGGQCTAVNAFAYDGLHAAARIARAVGNPERGGELQIMAEDIREAVNDLMWDPSQGVYIDGIQNGVRSSVVSEQANVLCALVGVADKRQVRGILDALDAVIAGNEMPMVRIGTPYFSFYLLRLLYAHGRHAVALRYTRERWGEMLAHGATTFWEQWDPLHSLCHAWSATPAYDLMAEIAGIRALQPGFEEFTIDLNPCDLTWLRACVPTPRGDAKVDYQRHAAYFNLELDGNSAEARALAITVNLTVPTGTRAFVRIPVHGIAMPTVTLNGKPVWVEGHPVAPSSDKFVREGDHIAFTILGGRYQVEAG